jgi:DNA-binding protein Fis
MMTLDEMERSYIEEVVRACGGNQAQAARVLGISRTSLWRKLRKPSASRGKSVPAGNEPDVRS